MNVKSNISIYGVVDKLFTDKTLVARARARLEVERKEQARQLKIRDNDCPTCGGILVRGKRNKKNDYKREWACTECFEVHTI